MKKSIIYSFLGGILFTVLVMIGIIYFNSQKTNPYKVRLCENEGVRVLINDIMQDVTNDTINKLSFYYGRSFPALKVNVGIIQDNIVTIDRQPRYAACQVSLLLKADYNNKKPLTLDFYKYIVRVSDNAETVNIKNENNEQERAYIHEKISQWILDITK